MRITTSLTSRAVAVALTGLAVANVAACAGGSNPVRDIATSVGAGPKVTEAPDFVAQSRPGSLDYMPITAAGPGRQTAARTAEEVKAAEAEMDSLRARNEAAGAAAAKLGGTPPPEPVTLPKKPNSKKNP
jgi:hypothetical protein